MLESVFVRSNTSKDNFETGMQGTFRICVPQTQKLAASIYNSWWGGGSLLILPLPKTLPNPRA